MSKAKIIRAADLFCGAGGASNGLARAADRMGRSLDLVAVNHWPMAVDTHTRNHPGARHLCEDLETVNPRKAVPGGHLDLLMAGPECTHHSTARGGKPVNDQSRASAWCILRWASTLTIDRILIENVREFMSWGPIGSNGRPLKSRRGETFQAFLEGLRSLGYRFDHRILNAADHGDPTTRERLFIQAVRGRRPIVWPEPTHTKGGGADMFGTRKPWRPAREVIDWSIPGESIFTRKRPLSPNTLARIAAGLRKFGGLAAEPFLVLLNSTNPKRLPSTAMDIDRPVPTITGSGHIGLCEPFIVPFRGERDGETPRTHSLDEPMPTVTTIRGHGLVEPFILPPEGIYRGNAPRSVDDPLQTITAGRGGGQLVEPFVISMEHSEKRAAEPFVVPTNHGASKGGSQRAYPIDRPMPTITTVDAWGLIEPFITKYHGNVSAVPVSDPLPTIDCKDRFGLVEINGQAAQLDIRFRMLQPHELAAAHSFPPDYQFAGNREQRVKQIGNSWPNALSEALCFAILSGGAA